MTTLTPYLFFDGNCREAMEFYRSCFGGELQAATFGEREGESCPAARRDWIIYASLQRDGFFLMASDDPMAKPVIGSNVQIAIECTSVAEQDKVFSTLSQGGKILQPLEDMFWGDRFGMVTDKYGFYWLISYAKNRKA